MNPRRLWPLVAALGSLLLGRVARADGDDDARNRVDVEAAQAILAVQSLDGWLLCEPGSQNPIADELVGPGGGTTRAWFYFIPASGQPTVLVHQSESAAFDSVPGTKVEYTGYRDLKTSLRALLKGTHRVAMEYAPKSGIASLTRVDAATVDLVRGMGVTVSSSAELVQFTKSLWRPEGRVAHYVAMHHLAKLKTAALAFIASELAAGHAVTEQDVQKQILHGFEVRGLEGPAPIVAAGVHTADPQYTPKKKGATAIKEGDLVLLDLSARVANADRPIYARLAWVAYVGDTVPERYASAFAEVAKARDRVIDFVTDRVAHQRAVKGFEADQEARNSLAQAGFGDKFLHRTGHSLDSSLYGDGANLDDVETHDTRNLVVGSGFTVGPGLYLKGDFGLRSVTCVYLGRGGLEKTGPRQDAITPVRAAP